jgi:outer membrane protein TolC
VIPGLEASLVEINKLLRAGEVDVLGVIDITRKLLRARDAELDARWELYQAQADLAAAVGDPTLAIAPETLAGSCPTP